MPAGVLIWIAIAIAAMPGVAQQARTRQPWDTCTHIDGKGGDDCAKGDRDRPFREFLHAETWVAGPKDWFSIEFAFEIRNGEFNAIWRELGRFGASRAREIRYFSGESVVGLVLVVEKRPGLFAPLLKWSGGQGDIPHAAVRRNGAVLTIEKDYKGNIPTWTTWAWVWSPAGPVFVDPMEALAKVIVRLLPGYGAYPAKMDWLSLNMMTWVWKGEWPGKVGVHAGLRAWFDLRGSKLVFKRAIFGDSETGESRTWAASP